MPTKPLVYAIELDGVRHAARRVVGSESLSAPFRFEVSFRIDGDDPLDPDALCGGAATLVIQKGHEVIRTQQATVTEAAREASTGTVPATSDVELVLEPRLAILRHRVDIRIFRDKTAPEIVLEVLGQQGVRASARLRSSYERRAYCVQWRESDLDFVHRLLEDEGIAYVVDDGEAVILVDHPSGWSPDRGPVQFRHGAGMTENDDAIVAVGLRGRATAGKVSLRDFHFEHPSLDMDVGAAGPSPGGPEHYDYPGEYTEPGAGAAKAKKRAAALRCARQQLLATSTRADLRPLAAFTLEGAPEGVASRRWGVTRVAHDWFPEKERGVIEVEALPDDAMLVPLQTTPIPTLNNPLTGFVTGPAGADIHTDAWGRVKVHFPWDRLQPKDDRCSDWIPILQDNTGESCAIARTGWEVVCHYMEGDPDRPVVLGRVFNAEDVFWEKLPEMKTRTSLRSLSSPRIEEKAPAANFITFEDQAGREEISLQAQRDQKVVVANDKTRQVDVDDTVLVQGHETAVIGANETFTVARDFDVKVEGNHTIAVAGNRKVEVGAADDSVVKGDHSLTIGGTHARRIGTNDRTNTKENLTETVPALILEASVKENTTTAKRISALLVGGAIVEIARLGKQERTDKLKVEVVGGLLMQQAKAAMSGKTTKTRNLLVGARLDVQSGKGMLVVGREKLTMKAAQGVFDGDTLEMAVGETRLRMKEGAIELHATEKITITTSGPNDQTSSTSTQR